MRDPRTVPIAPLALLMLAGLAAVTFVPTASAMCAVDAEGGCQAMHTDLALTVQPCPGSASLCLASPDGAEAVFVPAGGNLNLTVSNALGVPIDVQVLVIERYDDAAADGSTRVRADELVALTIPAGQHATRLQAIDGNVSKVRFQAVAQDGREGEVDASAQAIMYMTGGVAGGEGADGDGEVDPDGGGPDDRSADAGAKGNDAPYLGVVAVVGVLAAVVGLRRAD